MPFYTVHDILEVRILNGLPFPLPMICPSWVVLCDKAHSFTELSKPLCHNKAHEGEMPDWMDHNLESRLLGEISTTSDMQMIPLKWQKVKMN